MDLLHFVWHRNGGGRLRRLDASFLSTVPILVKYLRQRALQPRAQHTVSQTFPIPDSGEMSVSESPPVTSAVHILADLPIPSPIYSSTASTLNVVKTDLPKLPQVPYPSSQLPSNDIPTVEPHLPQVFLSRQFFCFLGIVAVAVALHFFIRGDLRMLAIN